MESFGCFGLMLGFSLAVISIVALAIALRALHAVERLEQQLAQRREPADAAATPPVQEPPIAPSEWPLETPPPPPEPMTAPPPFVDAEPPAPVDLGRPLSTDEQVGSVPSFEAPPSPEPEAQPAGDETRRRSLFDFDFEDFIGVRLFSWVAGIALLVGALFFLRYSVEHGWLTPRIRLAGGVLTGIALIVISELRVASRYRTSANAMNGAAIAILYATLFAAHQLWHLVNGGVAFALMIAVTAAAVYLATRHESMFIALLGLVGGFATPALLATGEDRPVGLFSYLLLLNAGLSAIAYRKRWNSLVVLSFLFTTLYQWAWVVRFLDSTKLPVAAAFFLLVPLAGIAVVFAGRRDDTTARSTNAAGLLMPLLFALYVASHPALAGSSNLLFGFLFCITSGLTILAALREDNRVLYTMGTTGSLLVSVVWLLQSYDASAWPSFALWQTAILGAALVAIPLTRRFGRGLGSEEVRGSTIAAASLVVFVLLPLREAATAQPAALFTLLFALVVLAMAATITTGAWRIYGVAAAMSIAATAVWSNRFLDPAHLHAALILYGALTVLLAAGAVIPRRIDETLRPTDLHGTLIVAAITLLFFLSRPSIAGASLEGLALLLLVAVAATWVAERTSGTSALPSRIAAVFVWLVLGSWWLRTNVADQRGSAIAVVTATVVVFALFAILRQRRGDDSAANAAPLAGYAFLLVVAATPSLSEPPASLLISLYVTFCAIAAACAMTRRFTPHLFSTAGAHLVVLTWIVASSRKSVSTEALLYEALLAATATGIAELVRWRRGPSERDASLTASSVLALLFGLVVIDAAVATTTAPPLTLALSLSAGLLIALFAIARFRDADAATLLAVLPASLAPVLWYEHAGSPLGSGLTFGGIIALLFFLNPIVLIDRARVRLVPYVAAGLAGALALVFARSVLAGHGHPRLSGTVALSEAALAALAVWQLVRAERRGERHRGRLALASAIALAFLTAAVPLILDREWITVGWAMEVAALAWLQRKVPHRGLLAAVGALAAVVFARIALNPAVLSYHPRSTTPVLNWYLYTYGVVAASFFIAAIELRKSGTGARLRAALVSLATVTLFLLLNIEIADYYSKGTTLTFDFDATLGQDLSYTILWGVFAIALLIAGIIAKSRGARIAAIGLLTVTMLKCFLHDLAKLGGLYRVGAFVGLAVCLLAVALLLQRFVVAQPRARSGASE